MLVENEMILIKGDKGLCQTLKYNSGCIPKSKTHWLIEWGTKDLLQSDWACFKIYKKGLVVKF